MAEVGQLASTVKSILVCSSVVITPRRSVYSATSLYTCELATSSFNDITPVVKATDTMLAFTGVPSLCRMLNCQSIMQFNPKSATVQI